MEDISNEVMVFTLDIIDELLEKMGFLLACEEVCIPAPRPYLTWCDWTRSAKPKATEYVEGIKLQEQLNTLRVKYSMPEVPVKPLPETNHPTLRELRQLVGYTSLLRQYQSSTNIVVKLSSYPYRIPHQLIDRLISIANISKVCRTSHEEYKDISLDTDVVAKVIQLAEDLYMAYIR
jgi:hypothetical protein